MAAMKLGPWAAIAAAALLGACGRKTANDGKIVLRYLAAPDVGGFSKAIIERFERENPGVRVEMIEGPADSDTRANMYAASFMGEEDTYDLAYMDVVWVAKFASQSWLAPLDERVPKSLRADLLEGGVAAGTYEGRLYALPVQADAGVLYYRKDLLAERGLRPPSSWAELARDAAALKTADRAGFVFQGKQYEGLVCVFLELVWGFGGDLIDAEGRVRIAEPPAVAALQALVDAIHRSGAAPKAVLTYQEEEARQAFQQGRAVFMRNWPYAWPLMQAPGSPVRGRVGLIPMVAGPGGSRAATLGGWMFGVSRFSRHPEEAWKLAEFFASPESERLALEKGGILPSRKSLYADAKLLAVNPFLKDIYRVLKTARPRPPVARWPRVSDSLQIHVSAALSLQEEPKEALARAAAEIEQASRMKPR